MLKHERHQMIVELVKQKKTCTIDELCERLGVSAITLYRDLRTLDEDNVIRRVHGGVTLREPDPMIFRFADRLGINSAAKDRIGQTAAETVQEDSGIFVDASSSCYYFAQHLAQRRKSRLTLVTSSPSIPLLFESCPQIRAISTGGELHHTLNTYGGPIAMRVLEEMNFDTAYVSCAGFNLKHGATTDSPVLVEMLQGVARRANKVILLVDSSKFSRLAMMTSLRTSAITRIVTDDQICSDVVLRIMDAGIEVSIAGSEITEPNPHDTKATEDQTVRETGTSCGTEKRTREDE